MLWHGANYIRKQWQINTSILLQAMEFKLYFAEKTVFGQQSW